MQCTVQEQNEMNEQFKQVLMAIGYRTSQTNVAKRGNLLPGLYEELERRGFTFQTKRYANSLGQAEEWLQINW